MKQIPGYAAVSPIVRTPRTPRAVTGYRKERTPSPCCCLDTAEDVLA